MIKACDFDWPNVKAPEITTEGVDTFIRYGDGAVSRFPKNFIVPDGSHTEESVFQMGRSSYIGQNSKVHFDSELCRLEIGNFCSIAYGVNFLPGSFHPMNTISTYIFEFIDGFVTETIHALNLNRTIVIKNDVWLGKNVFICGDSIIGNGAVLGAHCLVPRGKVLEDYGIYAGTPAKLLRFRFPEKIIALLNQLAWYDMPIDFIKQHADFFKVDLNHDVGRSSELLQELIRQKGHYVWHPDQAIDYHPL